MSYRLTAIISFPRAVLVTPLLVLTFLPVVLFSWWLLSNLSRCSLLKAARPERLPDKMPVNPIVPPSSSI
jgi:hypothetical protein